MDARPVMLQAILATVAVQTGRRAASPLFVGRQSELAALDVALADGGRTGAVLVGGEAGAGKTRLVAEFAARARAGGTTVVTGACVALGAEGLPFAPFMGALGELASHLGPDGLDAVAGPGRVELARLVPDLRRPEDEQRPTGPAERSVLFHVVARTLEAAADHGPLVMVVEDLHWADTSSRDLLAFLLSRPHGALLVVATYRSDEVHTTHPLRPLLAHAARSDRVVRLELAPLTPAEVGAQVEAIAGPDVAPAVVQAVVARAEGNPFFAEELLAASGGSALPPDLAEVLSGRLAALPFSGQQVLRVAAVAGRRVGHDLLAAVVKRSDADIEGGLREAVSHQLLVADDAGAYAFRHALLAEAAYGQLLPSERISLHAAYAATLASHPEWATTAAGAAGELAHHWVAARQPGRALEASVMAASAAATAYAFTEAHALYEQAVGLWAEVTEPSALAGCDRAELLLQAADAAVLAGGTGRAIALLEAAVAHVDPTTEPTRAAMVHERLARLLSECGETESSLAAIRAAETLMPSEPSSERAQLIAVEARTLVQAGRYRESCARAQDAIEIARAADARRVEGYALNTLGVGLGRLGNAEEAVTLLQQALTIARDVGSLEDIRRAYNNLFVTLTDGVCDPGRAGSVALEGAAHLDAIGYEDGANLLRAAGASSLAISGRWAEADDLARNVLGSRPGNKAAWVAQLTMATIALRSGDFRAAHRYLDDARDLWSGSENTDYRAMLAITQAELALAEGRTEEGLAIVDAGLAGLRDAEAQDYVYSLVSFGLQAVADARRPPARLAGAADLIARARAIGSVVVEGNGQPTRQSRALLLRCEAEWARVREEPDAGLWADVAVAWGAAYPYEVAYAGWRQAEAHLAHGAKVEGVAALRQAFTDASRLGATVLVSGIEALARRARVRLAEDHGARRDSAPSGLTRREAEVLALVAAGHTNRQIAETLFMSEKTASVHVSRILTKLGVTNRAQAASIAHRLHLVEELG